MQIKHARPVVEASLRALARRAVGRREEWEEARSGYEGEVLLLREAERGALAKLEAIHEQKRAALKTQFDSLKQSIVSLTASSLQQVSSTLNSM
jgi:hypothetical protein